MLDTTRYLIDLYLAGNYHEILQLIPTFNSTQLPVAARLIVSLVLLNLGRIDSALRELAVSIELANCDQERHLLIEYLVKAQQLQNDFIQIPAIHEQAEMFLLADGHLEDNSLGRICIITNNLCKNVLEILDSKKKVGLLNKFVQSIKYFGPLYVYNEIVSKRDILEMCMSEEISKYPELEYNYCPSSTMLEMIGRLTQHSCSKVFSLAISGLIVKHQLVRGFLCYLDAEYDQAFQIFEWLEVYFMGSEEVLIDRNEYLSNVTRRQVILLEVSSYLMSADTPSLEFIPHNQDYDSKKPKSNDKIDKIGILLLSISMIGKEMNHISELLSGRLSLYFICAGGLYEKLSFEKATQVEVNGNIKALRLSQIDIKEMLRKYILAATMKAHDDPTVIDLYQRILWGLLLFGGIHLQAFWFFKFIRDYFFKELSVGPIFIDKTLKFHPFKENDVLARYSNGHDLVEKVYSLRRSMLKESTSIDNDITPLFQKDSYQHLVPQVFHLDDQFMFSDQFYDEQEPCDGHRDFVSISNSEVTLKIVEERPISDGTVLRNTKISAGLMRIWLNSFLNYRRQVPEEIIDFWVESKMGSVTFKDGEEENL